MTTTNHLACERLEDRDTPAGNVSAYISGAQLFVIGDANDNLVSVQQDAAGNVSVIGQEGTTVNGQASVYLGQGLLSDAIVQGGGGNDQLDVVGIYATNSISVTTGDGNDLIQLREVTANYVSAYAQGGSDRVVSSNLIAQVGATLSGGAGTDVWQNYYLYAGQYFNYEGFESIQSFV